MSFTYTEAAGPINQALFQVTHGLYILTSVWGDQVNGQCVDAVMQVTNAPPCVAVGVGVKTLTHEMVLASGRFSLSVLDRENASCSDIVRRFGFQSGRDVDKFAGLMYERNRDGIPYLPDAVAVYDCRVLPDRCMDLGTHTLFVARVDRAGISGHGEPLSYNEYRQWLRKERS